MSRRRSGRGVDLVEEADRTWADDLPPVGEVDHSSWWEEEWAEETLAVTMRVYRKHAFRLYFGPSHAWLREDLEDWLILQAMELRARWRPPLNPYPDLERTWYASLYVYLSKAAAGHFPAVARYGVPGNDAWIIATRSDSIERISEQQSETGHLPGMRAVHGHLEMMDPPRFLSLIETLHEREDPDPSPGKPANLCTELGCRNVLTAGGHLCSRHKSRRRALQRDDRCTAPGCERYAASLGLCHGHYMKDRLADPDRPRCLAEDCSNPQQSRGLCGTHFVAFTRTGKEMPLAPVLESMAGVVCEADGCDLPAMTRRRCNAHYKHLLLQEADPCTVPDCDKPQFVKGLCSAHYTRLKRHGSLDLPEKITPECTDPECTDPGVRKGQCSKHYQRTYKAAKRAAAA